MTQLRRLSLSVLLLALTAPAFAQDNPPPRDDRPARQGRPPRPQRDDRSPTDRYNIDQAISDHAQLTTIAFSGLAFVSGDFSASTFLPPGKVCDFFGFQYLRDIDATNAGHNPKFLGRIAANVFHILTPDQLSLFSQLASEQAPLYDQIARDRWPLIKAFHRNLDADLPPGSKGLNHDAVQAHLADLFTRDADLAYRRAQTYGQVIATLTPDQKSALAKLKFGDFRTWPELSEQPYHLPREAGHMANVLYMTYASEFFSWYAGSVDADVYFCPERHGTYFGGFYMKDAPAMGKRDYNIPTSLTGDSGDAFLSLLTPDQRRHITAIPDLQRNWMTEIVSVRRDISTQLRTFITGQTPDRKAIDQLGSRYGQLDAELSYTYATAFASVGRSLTPAQKEKIHALRNLPGFTPAPAYLYSEPQKQAPTLPSSDRFFFPPSSPKTAATP
jgi:Spy/CpxP family protein refolding chaperone